MARIYSARIHTNTGNQWTWAVSDDEGGWGELNAYLDGAPPNWRQGFLWDHIRQRFWSKGTSVIYAAIQVRDTAAKSAGTEFISEHEWQAQLNSQMQWTPWWKPGQTKP